jgi:hypothetical protein
MIIPDINVILHAYNAESPVHARARAWWETVLSEPSPVGVPWAVALGFVRIATHTRVLANPLPVDVACAHVESWLEQPQVSLLHAGERHATIVFGLLRNLGSAGDLTTDAHLAALAIEHQAELQSTDADFARFPGLRYRNPVAGK